MLQQPTLAIIEDNNDLQEELNFFLKAKGYECWTATSAEEFWRKLHLQKADIFLVDIGLPGEDGFSLISHLSKLGDFGLVIITARGGKKDYLNGLNLGADLYLVKPVNFLELNEKLQALWQRMQLNKNEASDAAKNQPLIETTKKTGWRLESANSCLVNPKEETLHLTQQEKELLELLLDQPNQILTRIYLNDALFKHQGYSDDTHRVDVIVSRLRKKARDQDFTLPLKSIFAKGLVFIVEE
ncbi:response regulator transcription factor [Marinomonas sp. M1K-6]|uniref:Response regulator transcription factor n=1 Tax=Marinomonas profundi TaxID=2726122 RepID=A0A847R041_9GAMM|nr:response regulator transcription factor [Marinomonas profundi]NLQ19179.1 response regulator transcription factor [Marinomonas profundi]UDV03628.1 response regulator transcription factor [Marinomonas profundi]